MKIKKLSNKSLVIITNRFYILVSYETVVLIYDKTNELFYKLDKFIKKDFYNQTYEVTGSRTTTKHINEFLSYYNLINIYEDKTKIKTVTADFINSIDLNISITDIAKIEK